MNLICFCFSAFLLSFPFFFLLSLQAADYYDIIEHPMDLSSMMAKIDLHEYSTVRHFLNDIDLICSNALEYNPDRGPMGESVCGRIYVGQSCPNSKMNSRLCKQ